MMPTFHDGYIVGVWTSVAGFAFGCWVNWYFFGAESADDAPPRRDRW